MHQGRGGGVQIEQFGWFCEPHHVGGSVQSGERKGEGVVGGEAAGFGRGERRIENRERKSGGVGSR
jgi:hypothetical protein